MTNEIRCKIEIRAAADSPGRVVGTILELGRIASDRAEVFTPNSVQWPAAGLRLLSEHRGREVMKVMPTVEGSEIRIDAPLPDTSLARSLAAEIRSGKKRGLSVEFYPSDEADVAGVREIRGALIDAVAAVANPAYEQARLEIRNRGRRRIWL